MGLFISLSAAIHMSIMQHSLSFDPRDQPTNERNVNNYDNVDPPAGAAERFMREHHSTAIDDLSGVAGPPSPSSASSHHHHHHAVTPIGDDDPSDISTRNVYVSQLPHEVGDEELHQMFAAFGEIESAVVMRDIFTGVSRGIAFVQFRDDASATQAIEKMNLATVNGRVVGVQPARRFVKGPPSSRVFIRNIPKRVCEAELYDLLAPFGEITLLTIHPDTAKRDPYSPAMPPSPPPTPLLSSVERNIAFATFSTKEAALEAALALHNTRPFVGTDGNVPLMTKVVADDFMVKKQQRRRLHANQQQQRHQHPHHTPHRDVREEPHPPGTPGAYIPPHAHATTPSAELQWCLSPAPPTAAAMLSFNAVGPAPLVRVGPSVMPQNSSSPVVFDGLGLQPPPPVAFLSTAPPPVVHVIPFAPQPYAQPPPGLVGGVLYRTPFGDIIH